MIGQQIGQMICLNSFVKEVSHFVNIFYLFLNREGMEQLRAIIKCLTVLCLNTHNIPLVASIDLVKHVRLTIISLSLESGHPGDPT